MYRGRGHLSAKLRRLTPPVKCLTDNPRGARHCGASSRRELVCGRSIRILTMMQSCASAATAPGGGPILSVGISAMFVLRFPPPRIVNSAVREKPARAPNGAEWSARSDKPFQPAGRNTTPSSVSPVVTKRQSAMSSLRASATIIVLRVAAR